MGTLQSVANEKETEKTRDNFVTFSFVLGAWILLYILHVFIGSAYYTYVETASSPWAPGAVISSFTSEKPHQFWLLTVSELIVWFPLVVLVFVSMWRVLTVNKYNYILWVLVCIIFVLLGVTRFVGLCFIAAGCNSDEEPYNVCNSPFYCCKHANDTSICPNAYL
jgi:hypothetical protein